MWSEMSEVLQLFLSTTQSLFSLYTSVWFLSGALIIWIIRRILKTFNLI